MKNTLQFKVSVDLISVLMVCCALCRPLICLHFDRNLRNEAAKLIAVNCFFPETRTYNFSKINLFQLSFSSHRLPHAFARPATRAERP